MELFEFKTLLASTIAVACLALTRAIVRRNEWNGNVKFFLDQLLTEEVGESNRRYVLTVYRIYAFYVTLFAVYLIYLTL